MQGCGVTRGPHGDHSAGVQVESVEVLVWEVKVEILGAVSAEASCHISVKLP